MIRQPKVVRAKERQEEKKREPERERKRKKEREYKTRVECRRELLPLISHLNSFSMQIASQNEMKKRFYIENNTYILPL